MNLPSGLVFYLDFKYGTNQPGFTSGSGKDSQADSVFGITETSSDPIKRFVWCGRFGYSINDQESEAQTLGTVGTNKFVTGSLSVVITTTTLGSLHLANMDARFCIYSSFLLHLSQDLMTKESEDLE